jgi:hypothetical protein
MLAAPLAAAEAVVAQRLVLAHLEAVAAPALVLLVRAHLPHLP